jgi:hypothetical protein
LLGWKVRFMTNVLELKGAAVRGLTSAGG